MQPGLYQIRVVVRDNRSGLTGSSHEWIDIPEFAPGHLVVSSIFVSERIQASRSMDASGHFDLNIGKRFRATSDLDFVLQIYNASPHPGGTDPEVSVTTRVLRGNDVLIGGQPRTIKVSDTADASCISFAGSLSLKGFPSGAYSLEVDMKDLVGGNTAIEGIHLTVQ